MKKMLIFILILLIAIIVTVFLRPTKAPQNLYKASISEKTSSTNEGETVPANKSVELKNILLNAEAVFTGYGPGKSHSGTFTDYEISNISLTDGILTGGILEISTESLDFKIETLNEHLCGEKFFDCGNNPKITFELTSVVKNEVGGFAATGNLSFNGETKSISFPVNEIMSEFGELAYAVDFKLDTSLFGFGSTGVDKEVRIEARTK
jgi:polyisoprenoid-binding protein YceI